MSLKSYTISELDHGYLVSHERHRNPLARASAFTTLDEMLAYLRDEMEGGKDPCPGADDPSHSKN